MLFDLAKITYFIMRPLLFGDPMSQNAKTSIPTAAMLNAQDAEEETNVPAEETNETITITFNKKAIKKALFTTVGAAAVTYLVTRLLGSSEEETEDTTSED
jgi:hypothetical protein